jgi:TPR repeat protein
MFKKLTLALALAGVSTMAMADEFANAFQAAESSDYSKAASKWEELAKSGHPDAQMFLGMMYHSGAAGQRDEKAAVALYHKAAENGNYTAQEYLAAGYREGWFGLKKDRRKARYWEKQMKRNRAR